MPSQRAPELQAMLLCSHVRKETPDTLTLIRVFSHIRAPEFPHHHGAIWVYAKINGIDIPCRIEVDVVSLHDGALVAGGVAQETITEAGEMPMELALVVENMEFPHSGPYAFRLYANGLLFGTTSVLVTAA